MAKLTYEERQELPAKDFVYPSSRRYPIHDEAHARNALARASAYGSPSEKRAVCQAVNERYPEIHETHCPMVHKHRKGEGRFDGIMARLRR